MTPHDYTPEELAELGEDRFRRLVEDEARSTTTVDGPPGSDATGPARRNSPATSAALRSPLVLERFYAQLLVLRAGVEGRLAAKKAHFDVTRVSMLGDQPGRPTPNYLAAKSKYAEGRARALRFKTCLDQTLLEARQLRDAARADARARRLEAGIRRWWASFGEEEEPDDEDHTLWQLVSET